MHRKPALGKKILKAKILLQNPTKNPPSVTYILNHTSLLHLCIPKKEKRNKNPWFLRMASSKCNDLVGDTDFIEWQEAEKQFKISPSGLNIVMGNNDHYWKLFKSENGSEAAELIQVCWLEVVGCVENARPGTKYQVGFRVALKPNATGWDECTAIMVAKLGKSGKMIPIGIDLSQYYGKGLVDIPAEPLVVEVPQQASPSEQKISFGLYEIKQGNWKRGLEVHYAFVREIGSV